MPEIRYVFRCYFDQCHQLTEVVHNIPDTRKASGEGSSQKIEVTRYCAHCNRPNIIEVPEWWEPGSLVLGKDAAFLGYRDGIPLLQGKQE